MAGNDQWTSKKGKKLKPIKSKRDSDAIECGCGAVVNADEWDEHKEICDEVNKE